MSAAPEAAPRRDAVFLGQFPIHRACRDGDLRGLMSLSEQLVTRAPLSTEDSCLGWSPLHWAAHYGQLECVVHLVQLGCQVNAASSRLHQTPAHTAAFGGHPHCVVWLSQAGADVNRQDCVGETPIHKAARSGSLECIQVLLIAGAEPHLKNSRGQTAADLAHAHGFHECFCFISSARSDLQQLGGLQLNWEQNGDCGGAPCGQGPVYRKRQLPVKEARHMKRARRAEASVQQVVQTSPAQEDYMNMDLSSADDITKPLPLSQQDPQTSDPDHPGPPAPLHSANMCGSLHLSSSPGSSGSQTLLDPVDQDCRDFLLYGHQHGFGDTAEDLGDSGRFRSESGSGSGLRQPASGGVQLYHGS